MKKLKINKNVLGKLTNVQLGNLAGGLNLPSANCTKVSGVTTAR